MWAEAAMGVGAVAGVGTSVAAGYAVRQRNGHYKRLQARLDETLARDVDTRTLDLSARSAGFEHRLAVLLDLLPAEVLANLERETHGLADAERSYIPTHKKGGTFAYETLIQAAPGIVALYHSAALKGLVSSIVGETVVPTPLHDQSSLSVLVYDKPGDHIGWHYDHNFYRGRHFTVLIALVNRGTAEDGLSHATLFAKQPEGERAIRTAPNTFVVFEGARVIHRVTPIEAGERRVMISMTYATDPRARWWQGAARRMKDTAFFGIRALWT
jgi:hypothetical protein